ncbi:hypothetical protein HBH56_128800 [Parastagonospora nodorum]|uniref:Uncharacterized protein n=1 Tax=Phaeosphaeria nodorum (strain SN15 / ATCC MYA-4574 / FGSC 10173) TaxID=321614 RepID=A0A7U2NPE6_PHANO|nr:hypothetical protein HBH56_128800 [Parastagonospora nodorum]QRD05639.1 hypothetical protein JI435_059160 [Parastagonospora nodorum SN15]KAH4135031.1 hypothetical protein HBH45_154350 [Parastagonospora nodorum]KAH4189844.1 hypothetical protein HBH42_136550 [Parastagonospora nodorum]KAH4222001.1 hypothetical protein HBI06_153270 [Parastagonospora nodorum]
MLYKLPTLLLFVATFVTLALANKDSPDPCNGAPLCIKVPGGWVTTLDHTTTVTATATSVAPTVTASALWA